MQALRDPSAITNRQRQVVELIAQGLSNDEVGHELGISPRTAKAHCDILRQKLGVTRRRHIPVAFRLLTGEDPLASRLESARTKRGGGGRSDVHGTPLRRGRPGPSTCIRARKN
jgi:DNA-binding CsgD family transcriptional regulator